MSTRQEYLARRFERRTAPPVNSGTGRYAEVANDLAVLVAHEHARADEERRRREQVEMTASDLALLVAHEHAEAERERLARERAEAEAEQLRALLFGGRRPGRGAPRGMARLTRR